jgi:hypothetical protein
MRGTAVESQMKSMAKKVAVQIPYSAKSLVNDMDASGVSPTIWCICPFDAANAPDWEQPQLKARRSM